MLSRKHILTSAVLLSILGVNVGCTGEPDQLIDPETGKAITEQELRNVKIMTGLTDPTQKELNESYIRMRQERASIFGGNSSVEVHPNALSAE